MIRVCGGDLASGWDKNDFQKCKRQCAHRWNLLAGEVVVVVAAAESS